MAKCNLRLSYLVLSVTILLGGCGILHDDSGMQVDFEVTVTSDKSYTSPDDPVLLTVDVVNMGNIQGVWGRGSSSCQLGAIVREGNSDFPMVIDRACTDDLAEQGLDPGESRSESWSWDGRVFVKDGMEQLLPGLYDVVGAAGIWKSAVAVEIEIR